MKTLTGTLALAALLLVGAATAQAEPRLELRNVGAEAPKLGFDGWYDCPFGGPVPIGIWVNKVFSNTTAERIGLEPGDVIMEINGRRMNSNTDYHEALKDAKYRNGGYVRMLVSDVRTRTDYREGRRTEVRFYLP